MAGCSSCAAAGRACGTGACATAHGPSAARRQNTTSECLQFLARQGYSPDAWLALPRVQKQSIVQRWLQTAGMDFDRLRAKFPAASAALDGATQLPPNPATGAPNPLAAAAMTRAMRLIAGVVAYMDKQCAAAAGVQMATAAPRVASRPLLRGLPSMAWRGRAPPSMQYSPLEAGRDVDSTGLTDAQYNAALAAADAAAGGGPGSATQEQIDAALLAAGAHPYSDATIAAQSGAALSATGAGDAGLIGAQGGVDTGGYLVQPTFPPSTATPQGTTASGNANQDAAIITATGAATAALINAIAGATRPAPSAGVASGVPGTATTTNVQPSTAPQAAVTMPALSSGQKWAIGGTIAVIVVGGVVVAIFKGGR